MSKDNIPFENKFIRKADITDQFEDEEEAEEFRKWYEENLFKKNREKINEETINEQDVDEITDLRDLEDTNPFNLKRNSSKTTKNKGKNKDKKKPKKSVRTSRLRKSIVSVDSRDRDKTKYPKINNFKTFLGRNFTNVKSIRLLSTEFPNTEGVIKKGVNNKIYWVNEEDIDLNPPFPIYSIDIRPGSYTAISLKEEMVNKLGQVKRRNGQGEYHYFTSNIDLDTDIVTFRSFKVRNLSNNPISTTEGTGIINVNLIGHGFNDGEVVEMIGLKKVAGIPSNVLNGTFKIKFIDTANFEYEVNVNAIETKNSAGGNEVKVGKKAPFRFLWGEFNDSIGPLNLGFTNENSSEKLNPNNSTPLQTKTRNITDAQIISGYYSTENKLSLKVPSHDLKTSESILISSVSSGNPAKVTTSVPHNLSTGDVAFVKCLSCAPILNNQPFNVTVLSSNEFTIAVNINIQGSDGQVKIGGEQVSIEKLKVVPEFRNTSKVFLAEKNSSDSLNKIDIDFNADDITPTSIQQAFLGTERLVVTHKNHGFNSITNIQNNGVGIDGNKKVKITTLLEHGFKGTIFNASLSNGSQLNTIELNANSHGLTTGQNVSIENSNNIDGDYYVTVLDQNNFSIYFVGGLNASNSGNTCVVKTGNTVTLNKTNSTPIVDGTYSRVQKIDSKSFNIFNNNPKNIFSSGLSSTGNKGILGINNQINLYRAQGKVEEAKDIGGIDIEAINKKHKIEKIIDLNTYMIRTRGSYSNTETSGGGSEIYVSSEKHGVDYQQTNTVDGELLNRSVSLEGENYVFMVIPTFEDGTMTSSSGLKHIFAKLILDGPPNFVLFDNFLSNAKIFEDVPLRELGEIHVQIKTNDGILYNFNELDYSFSLEIVEYVDILKNSSYSSQRGVIDASSNIKDGSKNSQRNEDDEDEDEDD